jgi:hypothetical protein
MAYNANKPDAGDLLSQSQNDLKDNFTALKTLIDVNHETFAHASEGKHKHVTFPIQGAAPSTAADEVALYSKDNASGNPALYYRPESDGTEVEISSGKAQANGYQRFASGAMMKWGAGTVAQGAGTSDIEFDSTVAFTTVYSVTVTMKNGSDPSKDNYAPFVSSFSNTKVVVYNPNDKGGSHVCYYVAIGK